jgi:hypothetical protein
MVALERRGGQQNNRWEGDSDWITDGRKRAGPVSLSEMYIESNTYRDCSEKK